MTHWYSPRRRGLVPNHRRKAHALHHVRGLTARLERVCNDSCRFGWRCGDLEVLEPTSEDTSNRMSGRIEVVARVSGRHAWTVEQKLTVLRDAFGLGGSVRGSIERYELTSGQLYTWRRQAMSGELAEAPRSAVPGPFVDAPCFAEVRIADQIPPAPLVTMTHPTRAEAPDRIGIESPSGVRLSVEASVDVGALERALAEFGAGVRGTAPRVHRKRADPRLAGARRDRYEGGVRRFGGPHPGGLARGPALGRTFLYRSALLVVDEIGYLPVHPARGPILPACQRPLRRGR